MATLMFGRGDDSTAQHRSPDSMPNGTIKAETPWQARLYCTPAGLAVGVHRHIRPCQRRGGNGWCITQAKLWHQVGSVRGWRFDRCGRRATPEARPPHDGSGVLMACIKAWRHWREIKAWTWPNALPASMVLSSQVQASAGGGARDRKGGLGEGSGMPGRPCH